MKRNLFFFFALLLSATISLTSCGDADPCKDVTCGTADQGACFEGECVCNEGYEGTACADEWNTKFIGEYTGKDVCGPDTYTLTTPAVVSKVALNKLKIVNFGGFGLSSIEATIEKETASSLTADVIKIDYTDLASRKFVGTGKITGKTMTGSYTVTYPDATSDSCTFEYTKP